MTMNEIEKKNYCLNFLKGIACFCVVFMHCEFPGKLGIIIQCISRFCVPFFFMISGYFCYYENPSAYKGRKKILHIGKITLYTSIFYIIIGFINNIIPICSTIGLDSYSHQNFIYFIFFNKPFFIAGQLWFLFALLYDYIIFTMIHKYKLINKSFILIPLFIVAYICLAQIVHLSGYHIPNCIYRNFLIEGLPLFLLGYYLHTTKINMSNKICVAIFIISSLLCLPERYLLGRDFGVNIFTFPQVTALFLLGINNPSFGKDNKITQIGSMCSMYIYILHPFVWRTIEFMYKLVGFNNSTACAYVMPIVVAFLTLILSQLIVLINNKTKSEKYL